MIKRRGLGHVEAILSFVIFIGFIVFAFVFFSPFESNRTLKSTSDYAWREVSDFSSVDLEIYSVYVAYDNAPALIAIAVVSAPAGWNATVEDSSENVVPSYTDLNGVVHFQRPVNNFVRIKFGPDFANGSGSAGFLIPIQNYSISSSDAKKAVSERKLLELNSTYYSDYIGLKRQFNLPNRVYFGFSATFLDGTKILASREIPENAEVLSKSERVAVVRTPSGIVEYAELRVFVW